MMGEPGSMRDWAAHHRRATHRRCIEGVAAMLLTVAAFGAVTGWVVWIATA